MPSGVTTIVSTVGTGGALAAFWLKRGVEPSELTRHGHLCFSTVVGHRTFGRREGRSLGNAPRQVLVKERTINLLERVTHPGVFVRQTPRWG